MIYQNPYQNIRTADIYGARKQAAQDKLTAQDNALILEQKQLKLAQDKATQAYKIGSTFKSLTPERQAAQWNTTRQQLEVVYPEMKGQFPSSWDSDQAGNVAQLDLFLSKMSPLVSPERVTLKEGDVIQERMPGEQFKTIASGAAKPKKSIFSEEKITLPDGSQMMVDVVDLPSGSRQVGDFVKVWNKPNTKIPADQYYRENPEDWPYASENPYSQKKPINSLTVPPTAPMAVPGQTELPPRQLNTPSPTNRAGETNVGYGIDENAMLQQPQIMPSMGNMMQKGAGAIMADEFAPQPRNALVGGMMPQPSQFAELMPAGSAPNRFGSPGVEGMEFAATGGYKQELVPGGMRFSSPPKPGEAKETSRDMTAEEILASGRDPAEFSGQITSLGEKKYSPIPLKGFTKTQLDKMQQELENLRANAKTEAQKADVSRKEKLFVLRNLKQYEYALQKLENNPMFDTGPLDQYISARTPVGQQIVELGTRIEPLVRKVQRTPGDPAAASETASFGEMLPKLNKYLQNNFDNLNFITQYYLDLYGANAMVNSKEEYDALYSPDQDIVYIDLRDGKRYVKPKGKK